ncbi:MAG: T9SS type A sorting domain-containing protein, partial [Calditrichaeota bacterium]|nr:T9SS type A sorting domain-containing protein [Calditrichota bacterium]
IFTDPYDKCGFNEALNTRMVEVFGYNWGYGYDSLLADLERWRLSPYVTIDSLGASVQNRGIWQLTITSDSPPGPAGRRTVFIHARTHPGEVQSFWVTNEIINLLITEDPYARFVRDNCTFHIVPMFNPDGVELGYPRNNANDKDLERNWDTYPAQPEVEALRNRFLELMNSTEPIEVALNMHASGHTKRFFYFHDSAGTSYQYTLLEKDFIAGVISYFPGGFEPWDYSVTWKDSTLTYFPEGWFWINYGEAVMALTYEDTNIMVAGAYDTTAYALVRGITDYLGLEPTSVSNQLAVVQEDPLLVQNYPNPFNNSTRIEFNIAKSGQVELKIYNLLGETIRALVNEFQTPGSKSFSWDARDDHGQPVSSGLYIYRLVAGNSIHSGRMMYLK